MKNLSTTQQYFLCILKKNGKISSLEMEEDNLSGSFRCAGTFDGGYFNF